MKKAIVVLSFLLLPSLAFAAGFANGSLFLSKASVTEGDTVLIHAVVSNDESAKFAGTVTLTDSGATIGTLPITLAAGAAQTVSVSWSPAAGSHTVSAKLTSTDGTIMQQTSQTFMIAAKPKPAAVFTSPQSAAAIDSSANIQKTIAGVSPQVANVAEPVFTIIDGARDNAADVLDTQIASTKVKLANSQKPGVVLGTSTGPLADPKLTNPWGMFWYALYTAYLYILTLLRWLVGSAGIFYPFIAILFLYILWRAYRRIRRPSYN